MNTEQIKQMIRQIAEQSGVDPAYMLKLAQIESSYDPMKVNPKTGSSGLFQIHPMHKHPNPFNAEANTRFAVKMTRDNSDALKRNGLPVNEETLYVAHQQGARGVSEIYRALQRDKNVKDLPPDIQRNMNANNPQGAVTVRDWWGQWANKIKNTPTGTNSAPIARNQAPQQPSNTQRPTGQQLPPVLPQTPQLPPAFPQMPSSPTVPQRTMTPPIVQRQNPQTPSYPIAPPNDGAHTSTERKRAQTGSPENVQEAGTNPALVVLLLAAIAGAVYMASDGSNSRAAAVPKKEEDKYSIDLKVYAA